MSDRSDRLRERRSQAKEKVQKAADEAETDEVEEESEEQDEETPSIKDERKGRMLYLPPHQDKLIDKVYSSIKADYDFKYEESFLKNQHYYPLLAKYGLDVLENFDAKDARESLEEMGALDE
ncbi:hypothetical protein ACFSUP_04330 [Gracilibacillus thailandensis]|uniref:hypothetical protein n=1 Tax=Gracilibacillus thailandensis TaxID=563735 RepID=UPI003641BF85